MTLLRPLLIALSMFLTFFTVDLSSTSGQSRDKMSYSRVKVFLGEKTIRDLGQLGIPVDHGQVKKGVFIISDYSERAIRKIDTAGFRYNILIDDVQEFYKKRNRNNGSTPERKTNQQQLHDGCGYEESYPVPDGFSLGSMGGFFTYQEMLNHLDSMAANYPGLISTRAPIANDTTHNGHQVYYLKISDQPTIDQNEPEILYTGLHHAREPASLSNLIYYMYYLLENYSDDPAIQYLVDNTEMYFVPCVNPDGYIYNEQTDPNGGGMWRKNRRDNGDGTFGVDLNRNYGYEWGYDDNGSSPDPSTLVYRGDSAFSEPETQMMRQFTIDHNFQIALNYHTYSNLMIYPWGYQGSFLTPDSSTFRHFANHITKDNNYLYGTGDETVGYVTNGGSDDWMYGEQSVKNKILSMTPEVGALGFWPPSSEIIRQCKDNMWQNLRSAFLLHNYGRITDQSQVLTDQIKNDFIYRFERLGLDSGQFQLTIDPIDPGIKHVEDTVTYSSLQLLEERQDTITYHLDSCMVNGQRYRFETRIDNGAHTFRDTITRYYGQTQQPVADNAANLGNWSTNSWNLTTSYAFAGNQSFTDSPFGDYGNNLNQSIALESPIDLSNTANAILSFWTRWDIESGFDYVQLEVSTDNGNSWQPLCGEYTRAGTANQDEDQPLYDGNQKEWVREEINLKDYLGDQILLRFQLVTDQYTTKDGFYFDRFEVTTIPEEPIVANDDTVCQGDDVTFQTSSPNVKQWLIRQQVADTSSSFTYTFNNPGIFTAELVRGCQHITDTLSEQITVNEPISAAPFSFSQNGNSFDFTNAVSTSTFYSWSFGDNSSSNQPNPTHTYQEKGNYDVCLTVGNSCDTIKNCQTVTLSQTSIAHHQKENLINIFPQPVDESLTITWNSEMQNINGIKMRNVLGAEVIARTDIESTTEHYELKTGHLKAGLYLLTVNTGEEQLTRNVMIAD